MSRFADDARVNELKDEPRPKTLLKEQAYEQLKALITTGTYPSGTFLSERQLALRLGMSKTPIRSAIERLETEGFLVVSPQQGILVAELSLNDIIDHFEIRVALETFVMRRLAGRLRQEQIARLKKNLEAQLISAEKMDMLEHIKLDTDFHLILSECLGNQEIVKVMWHLRDKLNQLILRINSPRPDRMLESHKEHMDVFQALIEGDGELAASRMEEHLEWGQRFLISR